MRLKHLLSMVFGSSLIAASTLTAQAQAPMEYAPGGMAYDGYGGVPMPGNAPPGMYSPWPETSPYQNSYSQQSFNGGTWTESENQLTRRYRLSIDYLTGRSRVSHSTVGNTEALNYPQTIQNTIGTGQGQGQGQGGQQGTVLTPFLDSEAQGRVGFPLFAALKLERQKREMHNTGARIDWGWDNADDSGIRLGFLTNQGEFDYNARDYLPATRDTQRDFALYAIQQLHIINELTTQGNTAGAAQVRSDLDQLTAVQPTTVGRFNDVNMVLENNLDNLGGLPLDDGTIRRFADGTTFGGVTVPFDLEFQVSLRSELYGGKLESVMSPFASLGPFRIRPTVGARYFYLSERFRFFGKDSGLAYNSGGGQQGGGGGGANQTLSPDIKIHATPDRIDNDADGIVDNAGGEGGGGQQGGGQQQNQLNFFSFHDHFRYPIESFLNNSSDQHLGGADIGLTYDFGGDSLMLSGTSKVGLLANYAQLKMNGDNIAMHTRDSNLLLPSVLDATPNAFSDKQFRTHVSPMFEQQFNAEAALFRYVPVLRRVSIFEKARFRAGYSILLIGQVTDTAGSVNWQGNPAAGLFPTIREKRNTYSSYNYNFGVSWEF
ncbi:MAG: hypothetical protein ACKV2Q_06025 [Planctomycetaceae bacterium]